MDKEMLKIENIIKTYLEGKNDISNLSAEFRGLLKIDLGHINYEKQMQPNLMEFIGRMYAEATMLYDRIEFLRKTLEADTYLTFKNDDTKKRTETEIKSNTQVSAGVQKVKHQEINLSKLVKYLFDVREACKEKKDMLFTLREEA